MADNKINFNLVHSTSGWSDLSPDNATLLYAQMLGSLVRRTPDLVVKSIVRVTAATFAERQGWYARDVFSLYSSILDSMKDSREWVALVEHGKEHTREENLVNFSKFSERPGVALGFGGDGREFDVHGRMFDSLSFKFEWFDNTLDHPWQPWNWLIPFHSDDPENTHYFFNPSTGRCVMNLRSLDSDGESLLRFYGWAPSLPEGLNFFEVVR